MKSFPTYKTTFCRDAYAKTVAPEEWSVLLSQRRRWINSTIHNLFELLWIDRLCGFCLFSMRFVVLIDLMSTLIQPVTVGYIVYVRRGASERADTAAHIPRRAEASVDPDDVDHHPRRHLRSAGRRLHPQPQV